MPMNTEDQSSPTRDITAWADVIDGVPSDLFSSAESYRDFVRRWKALYREVSLWNRIGKHEARLWQAEFQVEETKKHNVYAAKRPAFYAVRAIPGVKPWRKPLIEKLKAKVAGPCPKEDATWLLLQRKAGKNWARAHCRWSRKPGDLAAVA
jgi:hypothetical protein